MDMTLTGQAGIALAPMRDLCWLTTASTMLHPLPSMPPAGAATEAMRDQTPSPSRVRAYRVRGFKATVKAGNGVALGDICGMGAADRKFSNCLGPRSVSPPV